MKSSKFKLAAVILVIVIFASIFFIASGSHGSSDAAFYQPSFKNINEEELINSYENSQFLKWSRNIILYLNMEYILFSILIYSDLFKLKSSELINAVLRFYSYSVFVVFFMNKKDGKKDNYVYS
jgi:hypothetical protein